MLRKARITQVLPDTTILLCARAVPYRPYISYRSYISYRAYRSYRSYIPGMIQIIQIIKLPYISCRSHISCRSYRWYRSGINRELSYLSDLSDLYDVSDIFDIYGLYDLHDMYDMYDLSILYGLSDLSQVWNRCSEHVPVKLAIHFVVFIYVPGICNSDVVIYGIRVSAAIAWVPMFPRWAGVSSSSRYLSFSRSLIAAAAVSDIYTSHIRGIYFYQERLWNRTQLFIVLPLHPVLFC